MATTVYGNTVKSYWRVYIYYYVYAEDETSITYRCWWGINWVKKIAGNDDATNYWTSNDRPTWLSGTGKTTENAYPTATLTQTWWNGDADKCYGYDYVTWKFTKTDVKQTPTIKAYISHNSTRALYKGSSSVTTKLNVPARPTCTISFNGNPAHSGDTVSNVPANVTKFYGYDMDIPADTPTESGYAFKSWNTAADGSGTDYYIGEKYKGNADATLYAQWGAVDPPTCEHGDVTFSTSSSNVIRSFTDISCDISDIELLHDDRTLVGVKMQINGHDSNVLTTDGLLTISGQTSGVPTFTAADEGEHTVYIVTEDSEAIGKYPIGTVNIVAPTWSNKIVIDTSKFPNIDANGNAILESVKIANYTTTPESWDSVDTYGLKFIKGDDGTTWAFDYVFDEDHVDNPLDDSPNIAVEVTYKSFETISPIGTKAFFTTSRNQNYSNGIYNVMFVSGVDNAIYPEYSSRVWWSKINNPLYFPDTNYIEVGSNDTAVQGLTKVGDYLAVVKQSKTTDTAIFLLYPTSFEEETTYAVKQGVQGVGALSRYSFNILGDETLFLSPKGVMAIVPSQDEEHKVQNRSFFIDKGLLAENNIDSYSFVYDGKYFLSVGNGHCYVLDGNQRNSWGNDKTNLVYECYYLDNVPANCFVRYKDALVFSDDKNVCIFNDGYVDAYDLDGNENVPVSAKWSTILDDDSALHYYKTMQKKGNLVSILPVETDAERSSTKVYVKKDDDAPVEIKRTFGDSSLIPSEMFINKKFKKYKRLQFILVNDSEEDFGVDEIVKNYTVGNYAKR